MINSEVEKIINKPPKLWAAGRTRKPLRGLGWGLNDEPARPPAHPALHRRTVLAEQLRHLAAAHDHGGLNTCTKKET